MSGDQATHPRELPVGDSRQGEGAGDAAGEESGGGG